MLRLFRTHKAWTAHFLMTPTLLGVTDCCWIALMHPIRAGRSSAFNLLTQWGLEVNGHEIVGLDHGVGHLAYIPTKNGVTRDVKPMLGGYGVQ